MVLIGSHKLRLPRLAITLKCFNYISAIVQVGEIKRRDVIFFSGPHTQIKPRKAGPEGPFIFADSKPHSVP